MTNDNSKAKMQSQIKSLTVQKQKYENFLKIEEPIIADARKQVNAFTPKVKDLQDQLRIQNINLSKYLNLMRKSPEITVAKNQIKNITNNIKQLEKERLTL